jgi:dTDP-glucose 4,6-dehydratase
VLPTIISQLMAGKRVALGALHPTRDFSFVADTVAGIDRGRGKPEQHWRSHQYRLRVRDLDR